MKITSLISLLGCALLSITLAINIHAQQFEWISDQLHGSTFMDIFEINGKYIGAVSTGALFHYDSTIDYQLSIYEFEFEGSGEPGFSLHEITSIFYPDNYATIAIEFVKETDLWLIVQSSFISEGKQKYRVILCNENFDIIAEQSLDTLGYPLPLQIDSYEGKTYILGSIIGPPRDELFYLKYTHSNPHYLPPIEINQSEPKPMFYITSMNLDQRTGNMLVFYFNGIAVLDSNLHQVENFDHTSHIATSDHGHLIGVGNHYYSHGARRQSWITGLRRLVFQKYDTLFNILTTDSFGIEGQDNYPFLAKSIDHKNGEFLVGGHLDGPLSNFQFDKSKKKFYLAKFDNDLNQIWYKEYGGDRAYILFGLKLLEDGGSLAYGFITDTLDDLRYAYVMYVDANGEILSSSTLPSETKFSIQIVNPGDETLRILNPDAIQARIELYDIQGCHLLTAEISADVSEISTESLPVGIYAYILIRDGRVIGSGKWVKGK